MNSAIRAHASAELIISIIGDIFQEIYWICKMNLTDLLGLQHRDYRKRLNFYAGCQTSFNMNTENYRLSRKTTCSRILRKILLKAQLYSSRSLTRILMFSSIALEQLSSILCKLIRIYLILRQQELSSFLEKCNSFRQHHRK